MKRGGPLRRKTPLKNTAPPRRTSEAAHPRPVQRSRLRKRTRPKFQSLEYREIKLKVKLRDGDCVAEPLVPSVACYGRREVHHLWRRSQGGPDAEWNLKLLCASHHAWVHQHVREARSLDLLRKAGQTAPAS